MKKNIFSKKNMPKINDLKTNLGRIDLTNSINREVKVSKKSKKDSLDLKKGLKKTLDTRQKIVIKFKKLKNITLDTLFFAKKKKIDINTKKDKGFRVKLDKFKFILKNNFGKKDKLGFPKKYKIIFFLVFGSIFLLILDGIFLQINVKNGYEKIISLKENFGNIENFRQKINGAKKNFLLSKILFIPFSIIPNSKLNDVGNLVSGGIELTNLLNEGLLVYKNTNNLVEKNSLENLNFIKLTQNLELSSDKINKYSIEALKNYDKIGDLGNENLNNKLKNLKKKLRKTSDLLTKLNNNYNILYDILGKDSTKKYLIIFQNNDEIRATGGFMGSLAILYLSDGKIEKIENKDIYALEWLVGKNYSEIEAPEGLNKITQTFGLRDANYYPEIKESSEQIKFFLDKTPYDIDGIVYLNQNLIRDLLGIVGEIDSKTIGKKINSKNFSLIISSLVEAEVAKVGTIGTPKQALFDFSGEFYKKLLAEKKYYKYLNVILKNIVSRDLVFYNFNPKENSLVWKLGVNGTINFSETLDFNYPVYLSIGGNKTDRYMNYKYEKTIKKIPGNCDYNIKLDIYNSSNFSKKDENEINKILSKYDNLGKKKIDILNIQGKGVNKSFLRILLPKNASVILKDGQNISENSRYKTIKFYTSTESSKRSMYEIEYNLKNPDCKPYTYKFLKQPGIRNYDITFVDSGEVYIYKDIKTDFIYKKIAN